MAGDKGTGLSMHENYSPFLSPWLARLNIRRNKLLLSNFRIPPFVGGGAAGDAPRLEIAFDNLIQRADVVISPMCKSAVAETVNLILTILFGTR